MSVRIRLRRMGKKKNPHYRLAVVDSRTKRDGRFVEFVGYYDPMTEPPRVKLDEEKIIGWIKNGASYSDTVRGILRDAGLLAKWHELRTGQKVERSPKPAAGAVKPEKPAARAKKEEAPVEAPAPEVEEKTVKKPAKAKKEDSAAEVPVAEAPAVEAPEEAPVAEAPAVEAPVEEAPAEEAPAEEAAVDEAAQSPADAEEKKD